MSIPQYPQPGDRKAFTAAFQTSLGREIGKAMRRVLLLSAAALTTHPAKAQAAASQPLAAVITPCDLLERPMEFNGKQVRVSGTVQAGLDDFLLRSENCTGIRRDLPAAVWIDLPEGTRSKAGPAIRTTLAAQSAPAQALSPGRLVRSRNFKAFEDALGAPLRSAGLCLGCTVNTVTATLTGRVDAVETLDWKHNGKRLTAIPGFGNLNAYRVRLVLEEVSDVTAHPVSYATAQDALASPSPTLPAGDPETLLKSTSDVFPNGSAAFGQLRRAGVAFGTRENRDGVLLRSFAPNEAHPAEQSAGGTSTSDGLVAYVDYDPARLGPDALVRALAVVGCQLADLREARSRPQLVDLDGHALQTLVLDAAATGVRGLTLPGGAVLWMNSWAEADRRQRVGLGLGTYVARWKQDVILRAPATREKETPRE